MNSNYGKPNQTSASSASLKNFNFDFALGIGSNRPKSLNDQKNQKSSHPYYSSSSSSYSSTQPRPSEQPNKPSWTHQPAPNLVNLSGLPGGPTSMVGDNFGKSSFSMGNMTGALPETSNTTTISGCWGSSSYNNTSMSANKSSNLGGPSMRSMNSGSSAGSGMDVNRDPFSSLAGFGSKPSGSLNSAGMATRNNKAEDDGFGDFQNASRPGSTTVPSSSSTADNIFTGGSTNLNQKPMKTSAGGGPIDMFFSSSSASAGSPTVTSEGFGGKSSSDINDWGLDMNLVEEEDMMWVAQPLSLKGFHLLLLGYRVLQQKVKGWTITSKVNLQMLLSGYLGLPSFLRKQMIMRV